MRNIVAMIARILASLPRMVIETVMVAGRLVHRLVARPADPMPAPSAQVEAIASSASDADASLIATKRVAAIMAAGRIPEPSEIEGLEPLQFKWLRSLNQRGLAVVACSDAMQLRAHLRGRAPIKGLVPYDVTAIDEVRAARAAAKSKPAPAKRRTLRDKLAEIEAQEQGLHP